MRLDKAVSLSGLSRSEAKKALAAGRVCVNGLPVKNPAGILKPGDCVTLDGKQIDLSEHVHIMINKPAGYLTATEDPHGEKTVLDLVDTALRKRGLGPVGRLDKDVTGLVLLTTDGVLAHRLISPKHDVSKVYTALVEGELDESCVKAFAEGMHFAEFDAKPALLEILAPSECRVHISEGKYHQVKRMLARVGHEVKALRRDSIGSIVLDNALSEGEWRMLTEEETDALYKSAGMER